MKAILKRKQRRKRREMLLQFRGKGSGGRLSEILREEGLIVKDRKNLMLKEESIVLREDTKQCIVSGSDKGAAGLELLMESMELTNLDSIELGSPPSPIFQTSPKLKRPSLKISKSGLRDIPLLDKVVKAERIKDWASNFRRGDPRYQILNFFQDVAQEGVTKKSFQPEMTSPLLRAFDRASVFTVWRPTSNEAIRKMMTKQGVGKALDIKGKSAKAGKLSGFVPFLQIHEEKHKKMVRTLPKDATMRVFYQSRENRAVAFQELVTVAEDMIEGFIESRNILASEEADDESQEAAMERFMWEIPNPEIVLIDDYASRNCWGVEIPERLFWEAYVMRKDITRAGEYDTKRPSLPAFQDMNFSALRYPVIDGPRPVVLQYSGDDPMCPLNLLVAYEESGRVLPVVSDFDCFVVGTRGVTFEERMGQNQIDILQNMVSSIEKILDGPPSADSWTNRWLEVLKKQPKKPEMPKYGLGDPTSYRMMGHAIDRLIEHGSVRHGAECFNYFFPQELDNEFLVISDSLPGKVPWKYMDVNGLQNFLMQKADEGYSFPLNPKWLLCDPGWKRIYDKLLANEQSSVRDSMNVWFPPDSGLREQIDRIHKKHPDGFVPDKTGRSSVRRSMQEGGDLGGTAAMDLAELELKHYLTFQRAKRKLRIALFFMRGFSNDPPVENKGRCDQISPRRGASRQEIVESIRKSIAVPSKKTSVCVVRTEVEEEESDRAEEEEAHRNGAA